MRHIQAHLVTGIVLRQAITRCLSDASEHTEHKISTGAIMRTLCLSRNTAKRYLQFAVDLGLLVKTPGPNKRVGWLYQTLDYTEFALCYFGTVEHHWFLHRFDFLSSGRPNWSAFEHHVSGLEIPLSWRNVSKPDAPRHHFGFVPYLSDDDGSDIILLTTQGQQPENVGRSV